MRLISQTLFNVRFQWRHGFYAVYVLVCACYWLLVRALPEAYREQAAQLLTFSDPSALGLIMAGGIILLERDQGVHDPLFVTPVRIAEYLAAKAVSLGLLSLAAAWVIHLYAAGVPASPLAFSAGIGLTSSFMTLLSVCAAVRCRTINGFILLSQAYAMPFILPLLGFFGIWETPLYWALPTEGSLRLLREPAGMAEVVCSIMVLILWNAIAFGWAHRSCRRHLKERIGTGEAGS